MRGPFLFRKIFPTSRLFLSFLGALGEAPFFYQILDGVFHVKSFVFIMVVNIMEMTILVLIRPRGFQNRVRVLFS